MSKTNNAAAASVPVCRTVVRLHHGSAVSVVVSTVRIGRSYETAIIGRDGTSDGFRSSCIAEARSEHQEVIEAVNGRRHGGRTAATLVSMMLDVGEPEFAAKAGRDATAPAPSAARVSL